MSKTRIQIFDEINAVNPTAALKVNEVLTACESVNKGANIVVEWLRDCKTYKTATVRVQKSVRAVCRIGINYDNMKAVIEKRENDELPATPQPRTWGFRLNEYLVAHNVGMKKDDPAYATIMPTTSYYLSFYHGSFKPTYTSVFLMNGEPVAKEALNGVLQASELKSEEMGDTFTCKIADINRIHANNLTMTDEHFVKQQTTAPLIPAICEPVA